MTLISRLQSWNKTLTGFRGCIQVQLIESIIYLDFILLGHQKCKRYFSRFSRSEATLPQQSIEPTAVTLLSATSSIEIAPSLWRGNNKSDNRRFQPELRSHGLRPNKYERNNTPHFTQPLYYFVFFIPFENLILSLYRIRMLR